MDGASLTDSGMAFQMTVNEQESVLADCEICTRDS